MVFPRAVIFEIASDNLFSTSEAMIRVGAFDEFAESRTRQFWQAQHLIKRFGGADIGQPWLTSPPGLEQLPRLPLTEPTRVSGSKPKRRRLVMP